MQMSMTYGDISANILIDHQPWGTDNVTVRLTDYDVIHAAQKEPQTLKVTDHVRVHTATGDNVCCRCIVK